MNTDPELHGLSNHLVKNRCYYDQNKNIVQFATTDRLLALQKIVRCKNNDVGILSVALDIRDQLLHQYKFVPIDTTYQCSMLNLMVHNT